MARSSNLKLLPALAAALCLAACGGSINRYSGPVRVVVSPAAPVVLPGESLVFGARTINSNGGISWSMAGGSADGTMLPGGEYIAPSVVPTPNTVTVTATYTRDTSVSTSVTITIVAPEYSNASLSGQCAISFRGRDPQGAGLAWAGEFTADGDGHITNGLEDVNDGLAGVTTAAAFTGSYAIGADGRGTLTLTPASGAAQQYRLVLSRPAPNAAAQLIAFGKGATAQGSGQILQQNPSYFSNAFNLAPAFLIQGEDDSQYAASGKSYPWAIAGEVAEDLYGNVTGITEDSNYAGTVTSGPVSGTYTFSMSASGRGSLSLPNPRGGTQHFAAYAVDGNFLFVSIDPGEPLLGTAEPEQNPTAALQGNWVYALSGFAARQNGAGQSQMVPAATAGAFATDGSGNITGGSVDTNDNGTVSGGVLSGSYTAPSAGRIRLSLSANGDANQTFAVYIFSLSPLQGFLIETDATGTEAGDIYAQSASPAGGVAGIYAFALAGWDASSTTPVPRDLLGTLTADGISAWKGTQDVNDNASLQSAQAFTGTFSMNPFGRGAATIGTSDYNFYMVSPTQLILLGADQATVLGEAEIY